MHYGITEEKGTTLHQNPDFSFPFPLAGTEALFMASYHDSLKPELELLSSERITALGIALKEFD